MVYESLDYACHHRFINYSLQFIFWLLDGPVIEINEQHTKIYYGDECDDLIDCIVKWYIRVQAFLTAVVFLNSNICLTRVIRMVRDTSQCDIYRDEVLPFDLYSEDSSFTELLPNLPRQKIIHALGLPVDVRTLNVLLNYSIVWEYYYFPVLQTVFNFIRNKYNKFRVKVACSWGWLKI